MSQPYFEYTTPQDRYFNYCLWSYQPVASVENKFRSVNLLLHSFQLAKLDSQAFEIVASLRASLGLFRTVWGIKWLNNKLIWEFYFYDYKRREREVSITRVLEVLKPYLNCRLRILDNLPYFMFSIDINEYLLSDSHQIETINMYIGNPGSTVSSGISYEITDQEITLRNFYFFFNPQQEFEDIVAKICCSAHIDCQDIYIHKILIPELKNCQTICIANKQRNDTIYFSGIDVNQLLIFLEMFAYPQEIINFVKFNQTKLDHLLYDVGFDYRVEEKKLLILKSGYYGVF
ncbi:hypothetical protein [Anabaena azotica]|uniref:hypothetical protein n=1 Tax=Anabaena azotica TaxID=197653 RepID=UPI0039A5A45D